MDLNPRPFTDMVKPSIIPFIGDTRPSKGWDFAEYSDSASFGSKLTQSLSDVEQNYASLSAQKKSLSSTVSTLQMATIKKGLDNFSLGHLSNIEFTGSKNNYEKVNQKNNQYVDYRTYLYTPLDQLNQSALKPKNEDDDEEYFEYMDEETPAKGHTIAHNLNLYSGFSGFNPFKEEDKENFKAFNDDSTMQMLSSNFMSPLRTLGQNVWNSANYYMNQIQAKSASIKGAPDVYFDNKIEKFDILSNYETVLKDFSENKSKQSQWNENWFFSFILRRWSDAKNLYKNATLFSGKVAAHVDDVQAPIEKQNAVSNRKAFDSYISSMDTLLGGLERLTGNGLSSNVSASQEEITSIKTQLEELAAVLDTSALDSGQTDVINELETRYSDLALPTTVDSDSSSDLSMLEDWWTRVGAEVPDYGMLLPVGVFAESAVDMASALELGNWEGSLDSSISEYISDEPGGFMDKAFNGYLSHIMKNFLPDNSASGVVTPKDLAIDNIKYGESVFGQLKANGIIDEAGNVSSKFNPDDTTIHLGITNDYYENDRIRGVLRKATLGPFEFESFDQKRSFNKEREQIRIVEPDGASLTLSEVKNLIGKGDTLQDQYSNTRRAYNVFFDMYESMTATSVNSAPSKPGPNIREVGPYQYELDVYSHANWKEYSDKTAIAKDGNGNEYAVGEWKDSGDKPLTLQFKSKNEAESFYTEIQQMMALLEPVLGSFEPTQDVGPGRYGVSYQDGVAVKTQLRVLNDNEGMLGENGVVSLGSPDHAVHIDYVHHTSYFKTEHWTDVSTELRDRIIQKIGKGIFTDSQINRMHKSKNKRLKEEYKEKKEEFDEQEYERVRSEMKSFMQRLDKQQKSLKEHEMQVEKRTKALLAEIKKADAAHQKRLEESRAAKRKQDAQMGAKKK